MRDNRWLDHIDGKARIRPHEQGHCPKVVSAPQIIDVHKSNERTHDRDSTTSNESTTLAQEQWHASCTHLCDAKAKARSLKGEKN